MIIRQAETQDAPFLQKLLLQLGYPHPDLADVERKLVSHDAEAYQLLVAEVDSQVIGFIALHCFSLIHLPGKMGRISAFCVDETVRSQGIGIKLLEAGEKYFAANGCFKIEVTSNERRTATHEFYAKRGYEVDSKRFAKYLKKH
jgi:N-acetylglutamate synthase-like GNAT family acetyltransferase